MGRPKEFDPGAALDIALECFKEHGYASASMATLTEEMGLGRASLYATYGDKRALYFAALENYAETTAGYVAEQLEQSEHPLEAIRELLREVARKAGADDDRHGCLLVNATAELGANDDEVRAFVARSFKRIEDTYHRALRRAQRQGDLDASKDPRALARFLVAQMQALRVVGKARPDPRLLKDVAETALSCLD